MNRRRFLAAGPLGLAGLAAHRPPTTGPMGLVIHSYWVRAKSPRPPDYPPINDPLLFLRHAAALRACGVQIRVTPGDADRLKLLRTTAERNEQYIEGIVTLPKSDAEVEKFEAEVRANKAAGVAIARTVCLSGRRYETFDSPDQFRRFADESWQALRRAEPVAARHRLTLAVENHKDWRTDEMVGWLNRLGSEWVRVCLDTGNSIALLEDPLATAEALAPFTVTTHLKDMAVAEADDGFFLSEVPFGDGFLDLPKLVAVLRAANPTVRLNLEMITRDPLRVPCLTPKFWATMPAVPARDLAAAAARARRRPARPLPAVSALDHASQLRAEARNVERCLAYAAERLAR